MDVVSVNIKFSRRLKKITQSQLAEYLGVTRTSVSNWESGFSKPPLNIILQVAKMIGATADDFLSIDLMKTGWHLGLHNTPNQIHLINDSVHLTAPNEVQEPPGIYTSKEDELSSLRLRIKRLELFISQKFPDFPLDQL